MQGIALLNRNFAITNDFVSQISNASLPYLLFITLQDLEQRIF